MSLHEYLCNKGQKWWHNTSDQKFDRKMFEYSRADITPTV